MKLPDDVWQVVLDTLEKFDGIKIDSEELKSHVERLCEIRLFDGGAFICDGNEFDVFVIPEKRGKWAIRREIKKLLADLSKKHEKAIVKIHPDNVASLRLAVGFGFEPIGTQGRQIVLERALWAA